MRTIRIFISSPGDVGPERAAAQRVLERLTRQYHGRVTLEGYLWEQESYEAGSAFHRQIPSPSKYDIAVFILWSRLGTPITVDSVTYPSGTVYEFEDAQQGPVASRPRVLMYRKKAAIQLDVALSQGELLEAKARFDQVQEFFKKYFEGHDGGLRGHNVFESTPDLEERLEEDLRKLIDSIRQSGATPAQGGAHPKTGSPYRGLRLFDEDDRHVFFGRTRALYQVVRALRRQEAAGRPFIVVFGKSGVGKSSFMRAGVAPYITGTNAIEGVSVWRRALFEPSDSTKDLVGGLAAALCDPEALPELAEGIGASAFADMLRQTPDAAVSLLRQSLSRLAPGGNARVLLLVDPLEEVFTRRSKGGGAASAGEGDEAEQRRLEQQHFAGVLHVLCVSRLVWVVATLRSDFYEQASAIPQLRELKEGEGQYHLAPLNAIEIGQAVLCPAEIAGLAFEESEERGPLSEELINAALRHTDPLPLLSYALDQLYERSNAAYTGVMTFRAFDELGGLEGALARRADEARNAASKRMTGKMSDAWNKVFGLLVDVDRDGRRVRLYARTEQFGSDDARVLSEELDKARLLITDKDDQGRAVVSIAHESMLREWPSLREWIDERAELLRLRSVIATEAREWLPTRSRELLILQGARLAKAEQLVRNPEGLELEPALTEYVNSASGHSRSRRKRTLTLAVVAVVVVLAAVGQAVVQRVRSHDQQVATQKLNENLTTFASFVSFLVSELDNKLFRARTPEQQKLVDDIRNSLADHYINLDIGLIPPARIVETADGMASGAEMLASIGEYESAIRVMERSIELFERSVPVPADELAKRLDKLGGMCYRASDYDRGEGAYRRSLRVRELAGDGDLVKVQVTLGGLAQLLKAQSRYVAAVVQLRRSISILRGAERADLQPVLAKQYDSLADILRNVAIYAPNTAEADLRNQESEEVSGLAIGIARQLGEKAAKDLANYESEYAVLLEKTGRITQAEATLLRLCEHRNDKTADLAAILYKLGRVQVSLGKLNEAEQTLQRSHQILESDPTHPRMAKCREARARLRAEQGRWSDAEAELRGVLDIRLAKLKGPNPDIFEARAMLAVVLDKLGRAEEAAVERDLAARLRSEFDELQRQDKRAAEPEKQ